MTAKIMALTAFLHHDLSLLGHDRSAAEVAEDIYRRYPAARDWGVTARSVARIAGPIACADLVIPSCKAHARRFAWMKRWQRLMAGLALKSERVRDGNVIGRNTAGIG